MLGSFLVFLNVCFVFVFFLEGDGMLFCCWRFFGAALKKGKQVLFWCIRRRKKRDWNSWWQIFGWFFHECEGVTSGNLGKTCGVDTKYGTFLNKNKSFYKVGPLPAISRGRTPINGLING